MGTPENWEDDRERNVRIQIWSGLKISHLRTSKEKGAPDGKNKTENRKH